jgi:hypothetical protein
LGTCDRWVPLSDRRYNLRMYRPCSWSLRISATVSIVLFFAFTALWDRSFFISDALLLMVRSHPTRWSLRSSRGELSFGAVRQGPTPASPTPSETGFQLEHQQPFNQLDYLLNIGRPKFTFLGFAYYSFSASGSKFRWLFVPICSLCLLALSLPICWAVRRRILPPHRCVQCGYDLRATPDRCPECGRVVEKAG